MERKTYKVLSNVELMNRAVAPETIRAHIVKTLSERAKQVAAPLSIDLGARMPTIKEMTDMAFWDFQIAMFAEFLCELNTLEFAMALEVRKLLDKKTGRPA